MEFYELVQAVHSLDLDEFNAKYRHPFLLEDDPDEMSATVEGHMGELPSGGATVRRVFEVAKKDGSDGPIVIGRSPQADVRLEQGSVSAWHAAIRKAPGGGWTITDGHSTNGTRLGEEPAAPGVALPLRFGSKVRFGPDASFTFFEPSRIHQVLKLLAPRILEALDPNAPVSEGTSRFQTKTRGRPGAEAPRERPRREHEGDQAIVLTAHCPPLKPTRLDVGKAVSIGRTDGNDIVLPHTSVSRKHATLTRDGDLVLVTDHGSANGTFLGEEKVRGAAFAIPGEAPIVIGPYEITISAEAQPHIAPEAVATTALRRDRLEGTLESMPLADMLQAAELNRRSGTLRVEDATKGRWGEIAFADGKPLRAELGTLKGDAAVLEMLKLRKGRFTLNAGVPAPGPDDGLASFMRLLMEGARQEDEGSQGG